MTSGKPTPIQIDLLADLHKWRMFVAICELGSLTRAALFLDSNQSLLSRQLNALERECGARLFNRTGRGVELSEVGQRIYPQVKALLGSAQQLESDIRGEARDPAGRVTLGLLPSLGPGLVGPLFAMLRSRHPGVQLKVLEGSSGQIDEWLADARIDIGILFRYGGSLAENEEPLAQVDSCLVGAPGDALTREPEVDVAALHELPFILPAAPNGLRTALDAMARQERIVVAPAIEADSLQLQKWLVQHDGLYTVLALHAVWHEAAAGQLQASRIRGWPLQRTVSMAFSRAKGPGRAVTVVAALIGEKVQEMARSGMWRMG